MQPVAEYPFGPFAYPSQPTQQTFIPSQILNNQNERTLYMHSLYLNHNSNSMAYKMVPLVFRNQDSTPIIVVTEGLSNDLTKLILTYNSTKTLAAEITNVPDTSLWVLRAGVVIFKFSNKAFFSPEFLRETVTHQWFMSATASFLFSKINYSRKAQHFAFSAQRPNDLSTGAIPVTRMLEVFWKPPTTPDLLNVLNVEIWSGNHKFTKEERFVITDNISDDSIEIYFEPDGQNSQGYTLVQVILRSFTNLELECVKDGHCEDTGKYSPDELAIPDLYIN